MNFPSKEDYKKVFLAIQHDMTGSHTKMLKAHYHAPQQNITATKLAKAAEHQHHGGANLQYARIVKMSSFELFTTQKARQ